MSADLELTVVQAPSDLGFIAGFAITEHMIHVAGGRSSRTPLILTSSNARHFERRKTPRDLGLRDVLVHGDAVWICGEYGQLAVSRDHGASWKLLDTGTEGCLHGLAVANDAVWVVGDAGYAARAISSPQRSALLRGPAKPDLAISSPQRSALLRGPAKPDLAIDERLDRIALDTKVRFGAVYAVGADIAMLGFDGALYRWRAGKLRVETGTGTTKPLSGLAITKAGTWILVGDGGYIARSPDGAWFSKAASGVTVDLEAVATLPDGRIVVVGGDGQILISTDDGRTWDKHASGLSAHLWSIERFGDALLIGGDDGLIVKLATPGDRTWEDRVNVFGGGAKPLDMRFAAGPDGFIATNLAAVIADVVDDDDDEPDDGDHEAFRTRGRGDVLGGTVDTLSRRGDPASFATSYGATMPPEAVAWFAAVRDRERIHELRIVDRTLPDVGDANLFDLLVCARGTWLVEAFCGVFCVGTTASGDPYEMEIYEWDGPRQILCFERAGCAVAADSLDSLAYRAALEAAKRAEHVSADAYDIGVRKLRHRVAPDLDAKRRDTELFFYRSRWICAFLDGASELANITQLFDADFNQIVPTEQLVARFDACERFIPTALYAMWRAFLFDESELVRYLEIGRRHKARVVRDAAKLIDELRAGRNELGAIHDVRTRLAGFRALDLDPRRSEARKLEAEQRERAAAARAAEIATELATGAYTKFAWKWLGDGAAHRALVERMETVPALAAQIAALDGLRALPDHERTIALPRLAAALAPELEAVLVGSIVRGDTLAGVVAPIADVADAVDDNDDDAAPGWAAIDRALEPIYHGAEPHAHYGTVVPYALGGSDPIHGISVYVRDTPVPHFHVVTYGFTDLFHKETDDPAVSGFGVELTMRVARRAGDTDVPMGVLVMLQNLGRYVFGSGNTFDIGHKMPLHGPIVADANTKLTAIVFAADPELGEFASPYGKARFLQIVGITEDEYQLVKEWSVTGLVEMLAKRMPALVTDLGRTSVLDDPATAIVVKRRADIEGASDEHVFAGDLAIDLDAVRIELGALYATALPHAMRGRIRHGRAFTLRGREAILKLVPGETPQLRRDDDGTFALTIPAALATELDARLRPGRAGEFRFELWPALTVVIAPTFIRDPAGRAVEVKGIVDADEARRMIDAENARLAGPAAADDDDDEPLDPTRVRAALAMTERALQLAPADRDVQFTHAMLLVDGDEAGLDTIDDLLRGLPALDASVRINVAVRMGKRAHERFGDAVDQVLADVLPDRIIGDRAFSVGGGAVASYGDVGEELFGELGDAILAHAPDRLARLVPALPANVNLLAQLAYKAIQAEQRDGALALYDRVLALPVPDGGDERGNYLRSLNNACVQAHAVKAYDMAVRIADRAQPFAAENPYIYHAAACAYAAVGDYAKALQQVKLAIEHDYDHLGKVEIDSDLGLLLEWPEFKALFRDWHARQEGN